MNFKKCIKRIIFEVEYFITKRKLISNSNNFLSYPLIIYMTFNKNELYNNYINGISVKDSVIKELSKKHKTFTRKLSRIHKEYSIEFYDRYNKWCERQRNIQEVKRYFGENAFDDINEILI